MGRSVSGSSLSSILSKQANAAANANSVNAGDVAAGEGSNGGQFTNTQVNGEACVWTQTPDEIEGVSSLPTSTEKFVKNDIKVKFLQQRLEVTIQGKPDVNLTGDLGGQIDVDGCTWNFDGSGNIVVSMEKKKSGEEWPFALRQD